MTDIYSKFNLEFETFAKVSAIFRENSFPTQ